MPASLSALANRIESETAAARAAPGADPDAAVRAIAAAAEAAGELAALMLGSQALEPRARFARLAEEGAIPFDLARRLMSLAGFETLAFRQCKTALDPSLLDVIVREELGAFDEFIALARVQA